MEIEFPNLVEPKATVNETVSFQVRVDDHFIWCEISFEALIRHFGAGGHHGNDMVEAFHDGRARIEQVAREHLQSSEGRPILLRTDNF